MTVVKPADLPLPPPDMPLHFPMLAGRLMQALRETLLAEDWGGLRPSHLRLLSTVPREGISITELAYPMTMTKQAVGQYVTQLEELGYLVTDVDPDDRRVRVVRRSAEGNAVVRRFEARVRRIEQGWARQVGPE